MKLVLWSIFCLSYVAALDRDWWKHSNVYEIFTPSFSDSDGDGWGDFKGIISKLDYLQNLGIDTIYLSPFHPSPMLDMGYDVTDYYAIHPSFGTMADFDQLMQELQKRNMKMMMDLVINHSSDQHEWFKKSVEKIEPYTSYYVWHDPKGYDDKGRPIEPNNWKDILGTSSAWTWNEKRQQFYYHAYLPQQPDLNYRNSQVVNEMKKIIKFWLTKGVAGIRLDAVSHIMEDLSFRDENPQVQAIKRGQVEYAVSYVTKTWNIDDTYSFVHHICSYVNEISAKENTLERIVALEAFGSEKQMRKYYGTVGSSSSGHYVFNFVLGNEDDYMTPSRLNTVINSWISITPKNSALNWQLGNHDRFRMSYKFIQEYVNVLYTSITALPGTMILYYGEEIGMTSGIIKPNQLRKFQNEYVRTPMQWDGSMNGGFSSHANTWLPVNPNYWRLNVKKDQADPDSVYNLVKSLLTLRTTDTFKYGDFEKFILAESVFVIKRSYKDETFIVVSNLGTEIEKIQLDQHLPVLSEGTALRVQISTSNSKLKKGAPVVRKKKRSFMMQPMSAVILKVEKNTSSNIPGFEDEISEEVDE